MLTLDADARELMARAQQGDPDAFGELYARHRRYVLSIAQRWHPGHADDIAQDVWVRALGSLHLWRPDMGSGPVGWLATITRNMCHDLARSAYTRHVEPVETVPDAGHDPYDAADDREQVATVLAGLSDAHRQALRLHYLAELSSPEIAALTGLPAPTIRTRLHYARRAARRLVTTINERTRA